MKFESYDPLKENTDGGLIVKEGNEVTGEFEVVKTEFEDTEPKEKTIDDVLSGVADVEAQEVFEYETIPKPISSAEKMQTEIQSGINDLREKIEKKTIEKRTNEEIDAYTEDDQRVAQKVERARDEGEAYSEDAKREEAVLENARLKWREEVQSGKERKAKADEDQAMRISYEDLRAGAFNRMTPLEQAVRTLKHTISLEHDELAYLLQTEVSARGNNPQQYEKTKIEILEHEEKLRENEYLLSKRQSTLDSVSKFENKLWGDTPQELFRNSEVLWADINNCESRKDLLSLFDVWGALPGVDITRKPVTNKEEVERFLSHMDEKSKEEQTEEASRLFENAHLRNLILELPQREIENKSHAEQVEMEQKEAIVSRLRKGANFSREEVVDHVPQELETLYEEERNLTNAKSILSSKVFRYAPFLMNLTKEGREKLSLLKRVGLDRKAVGTGNSNLEFARVFRLKAVKEKEAAMLGLVDRKFADFTEKRKWSQERVAFPLRYPVRPETEAELRKEDAILKSGARIPSGPRKIREVLGRQTKADSFLESIISAFFGGGKKEEESANKPVHTIVMPNRSGENVLSDIEEHNHRAEADRVREKIQAMEEVEAEGEVQEAQALPEEEAVVYTEAPKKEKQKRTIKAPMSAKPKKRSAKK